MLSARGVCLGFYISKYVILRGPAPPPSRSPHPPLLSKNYTFSKKQHHSLGKSGVEKRTSLTTALPLESFRLSGRQKHMVFTIRNAFGHVWGVLFGHPEKTSKIEKTRFCVRRLFIFSVLGCSWLNSKSDIGVFRRFGDVFAGLLCFFLFMHHFCHFDLAGHRQDGPQGG